ncbi:MAG TPA: NUDIX hydrolase [Candidatus Paceibacterota bacterium]|nr:NUDIX hydrolase [Candidatus Paceibacterota bacterium]
MKTVRKAAAIIRDGDRVLLVKERAPWMYGCWNWSQGSMEEGEAPEETAVREAKEETGLDTQIVRKLAMLTDTFPDTSELHVYEVAVTGGELAFPEWEIMELRWYTLEELAGMEKEFAGPWVAEVLRTFVL